MNIRSMLIANQNKRGKILQTMLELVVKQGIQATPMAQVAKVSGVAAGTIYHHFPSKEAIINELYLNLKIAFGKALMEGIDTNNDYKNNFFKIWENLYDYFCQEENAFHFAEQIGRCTMITSETKQKGEVYYLPVIEFFAKGISTKKIREMDLKLITNLIYGNVVTAVQLTLSGELIMTKDRLNSVIQSSWDSIAQN